MKNKNQHGGLRTPGHGKTLGRPKSNYLEQNIKIRCTAAEYREIIEKTDPRQRVEMLLEKIKE